MPRKKNGSLHWAVKKQQSRDLTATSKWRKKVTLVSIDVSMPALTDETQIEHITEPVADAVIVVSDIPSTSEDSDSTESTESAKFGEAVIEPRRIEKRKLQRNSFREFDHEAKKVRAETAQCQVSDTETEKSSRSPSHSPIVDIDLNTSNSSPSDLIKESVAVSPSLSPTHFESISEASPDEHLEIEENQELVDSSLGYDLDEIADHITSQMDFRSPAPSPPLELIRIKSSSSELSATRQSAFPLYSYFGNDAPPRARRQQIRRRVGLRYDGNNRIRSDQQKLPNFCGMSMEAVLSISPPLTLRELVDCDLVHRFMRDQCGSRRLQSILNELSSSECTSSISMLVAHLIGVNANLRFTAECVYGNYLMQMFFARGTEHDRAAMLSNFVYASVLRLSRNKFGCRVMQKALTTVSLEQKLEILRHFREQFYAMRERSSALLCQHANHVLQVALEQDLPFAAVEFVRDELEANLSHFSGHVYACRVVQSMIKAYGDELEVALLMNESELNHLALSKSKYGNYVIQCIIAQKAWYSNLQRIFNFRMQLIRDVLEPQNLWDLSQDKHGSNVIETCISAANQEQLGQLVACLCSTDRLQFEGAFLLRKMAVHQYANYVIKTLIDHCDEAMRTKIVLAIHRNVADLYEFDEYGGHGRYGYGDELLVKCKQLKLGFDRRRSEKTGISKEKTSTNGRRRQY